jgi:hypothetical protein
MRMPCSSDGILLSLNQLLTRRRSTPSNPAICDWLLLFFRVHVFLEFSNGYTLARRRLMRPGSFSQNALPPLYPKRLVRAYVSSRRGFFVGRLSFKRSSSFARRFSPTTAISPQFSGTTSSGTLSSKSYRTRLSACWRIATDICVSPWNPLWSSGSSHCFEGLPVLPRFAKQISRARQHPVQVP